MCRCAAKPVGFLAREAYTSARGKYATAVWYVLTLQFRSVIAAFWDNDRTFLPVYVLVTAWNQATSRRETWGFQGARDGIRRYSAAG